MAVIGANGKGIGGRARFPNRFKRQAFLILLALASHNDNKVGASAWGDRDSRAGRVKNRPAFCYATHER